MDQLTLKHVFIFNPNLKSPKKKPSDDEAQDAKLLYYYPEDSEILIKRSNIGIIEGTLSFLEAFSKTNTNFLLTELYKSYYIANNYEKDFIIGFILEKSSPMFSYNDNVNTKKKWLKMIVDHFYNLFSLFHVSLTDFFLNKENPEINDSIPENKINIIRDFVLSFKKYFEQEIKLPFIDNVQYFPMSNTLQQSIFLSVQRLNEKIPELVMSSIIFHGKIIHNQLPFDSFSLLYNLFCNFYNNKSKLNQFDTNPPSQIIQTINIDSSQLKDKYENMNKSPFRKIFKLNPKKDEFLIGIRDGESNNYDLFVPNIYINALDEEFKFLVFNYQDLLFFLFFDKKFEVAKKISTRIKKIKSWVEKYFQNHLPILEHIYYQTKERNETFCYLNSINRSIRFSNFIDRKGLDKKKFNLLLRNLFLNNDVQINSLTKYKNEYFYYMKTSKRKCVIIFSDSMSLAQIKNEIERIKNEQFHNVLLI